MSTQSTTQNNPNRKDDAYGNKTGVSDTKQTSQNRDTSSVGKQTETKKSQY